MKIIKGGIPTYYDENLYLKTLIPKKGGFTFMKGDTWFSIERWIGWGIIKVHLKTQVIVHQNIRHIVVYNKDFYQDMVKFGEMFGYERLEKNYLEKPCSPR